MENEKPTGKLKAVHIVGMPAPAGDPCLISFMKDHLQIAAGGKYFQLPYNQITSMKPKGKYNLQQEKKQSAGRVLVGGALLGVVGAIAGTTPKTKNSIRYKVLLTIEHTEGYIQFQISRKGKAKRLIRKVKSQFKV